MKNVLKMSILSLSFLCFFTFVFTSCKNLENTNEQSIPRSEWDADNIAYLNTTEYKSTSYTRTTSEQSGIIGSFTASCEDESTGNIAWEKTYTFIDTGYYEYLIWGWTSKLKYYKGTYSGTFKINKISDSEFQLSLTPTDGNSCDTYYYQVSNDGIYMYNYNKIIFPASY